MSEFDDLLHRFTTHAAQALPPIGDDLVERLELEGEDATTIVGEALAAAYLAGVDAGQTEVLAQAAEQGFDVKVEQLRSDDPPKE